MNILSLFDGISCGQVAINRAGIKYDKYFASEIDKTPIKINQANYPNTIQLGDVTKVNVKDLPQINLLIGGSPCQGFSFAGDELNFGDPRSKLFFEYVRLLKELKPKYFLLENVNMRKEFLDVISSHLGVKPLKINSKLVSAQNRVRYYWTNIPNVTIPEDRSIMLKDILKEDYDGIWVWPRGYNKGGVQDYKGKSPSITTSSWQHNFLIYKGKRDSDCKIEGYIDCNAQGNRVYSPEGKSNCLNATSGGIAGNGNGMVLLDGAVRKFTPVEAERLQTLPDNYTNYVSENQRFKAIGNGWTVDVIAHILRGIKD